MKNQALQCEEAKSKNHNWILGLCFNCGMSRRDFNSAQKEFRSQQGKIRRANRKSNL